MDWMDIGLIVIMAAFVAKGVMQGMVRQIIGLISILASLLLATRLSPWLARRLAALPSLRPMALPTAFAVIALGVWALLNLAGILWYNHSRGEDDDHWLDDLAGAVVGFCTGAILLTVLVLGSISLGVLSAERASHSFVMRWLMDAAEALVGIVP